MSIPPALIGKKFKDAFHTLLQHKDNFTSTSPPCSDIYELFNKESLDNKTYQSNKYNYILIGLYRTFRENQDLQQNKDCSLKGSYIYMVPSPNENLRQHDRLYLLRSNF